jgi:cell division protein FtsB
MWFSLRMRHPSGVVPLLVSVGLICYFGYHSVHGNHGLKARSQLNQKIERLESQIAGLQATQRRLERDVALMHPAKIDPDMLDEQARLLLNLAHPDDMTIMLRSKRL